MSHGWWHSLQMLQTTELINNSQHLQLQKTIQFTIIFFLVGGQEISLPPQFTQTADIPLQRQLSAPDLGLQRQDIAQFTRQLSTPAPQDLTQQAQQQQYTTNPQYQTPQF